MAVTIKKDFSFKKDTRHHNGEERSRRPDLTSLVYGKIPPQAIELEEAVLGAMMLEKDKQTEVLGILPSDECFYVDAHQKIYAAIKALYHAGSPVDLLTVTEQLRKQNELEIVGGAYYLTRLTMSVISSAHVDAHARIVMEKYMMRELIRISGMVIAQAYEDSTDVFELMDEAEQGLFGISNANVKQPYVKAPELATQAEANYLQRQQSDTEVIGISSGYRPLDNITTGWRKKRLIIIAARPSVGKTAFAINLLVNACLEISRNGNIITGSRNIGAAALFSLEMGTDEISNRIISNIGRLPLEGIDKGNLAEYQQELFYQANAIYCQSRIFIDDTAGLNIYGLRTKARRLVEVEGVELIIIDYLQLMSGVTDGRQGNREQEISTISRELKTLSKELEIPIIALSQLNREAEKRGEPQLSDLRESGAIEQDANMVIFLTRPDYQVSEAEGDPGLKGFLDVYIKKNRDGRIDKVPLYFIKEIQSVMDKAGYDSYKGMGWEQKPQQVFDDPRAGMGGSRLYIEGGIGDRDKPFG